MTTPVTVEELNAAADALRFAAQAYDRANKKRGEIVAECDQAASAENLARQHFDALTYRVREYGIITATGDGP